MEAPEVPSSHYNFECAFYAKYKTEVVFISADGELPEKKPEGLFIMLCFLKVFKGLLELSFFSYLKTAQEFLCGEKTLTFLVSTAKLCYGLASLNRFDEDCFVCVRRGF